jgi:hypothetical protein
MTILYIKTHNKTGLKYFGKTTRQGNDFENYKGSGKYWLRHLKKHGSDISTEIVGEFEDNDPLLVVTALQFSKEHQIVESKDWANLIEENGLDGIPIGSPGVRLGMTNSPEHRKRISEALKGKPTPWHIGNKYAVGEPWNKGRTITEEERKNLSEAHIGQTAWNKGKIMPKGLKRKGQPIVVCPHCKKEGGLGAMKRYHFENCKLKSDSNDMDKFDRFVGFSNA